MKLERHFIVLAVLGIILGEAGEIVGVFRGISFNCLKFLSLFGGLMVLGCLTPAMTDFFQETREEKVKILLWVCSLSVSLLALPRVDFIRHGIIEPAGFEEVLLRLKIHPLINFTTAIALSGILGFVATKRKHFETVIREFGRGIEEIIKKFILPGFMLATPGIVSLLDWEEVLKNPGAGYLKNIGVFFSGLLILALFFRGRLKKEWARGVYKSLFISFLIAPILIETPPSMGTIFIYFLIVIFSTSINPKVPPMIALGLFAEVTEISATALGSIIVLYFICHGIERGFCSIFHSV